jgi:hypothetical protein
MQAKVFFLGHFERNGWELRIAGSSERPFENKIVDCVLVSVCAEKEGEATIIVRSRTSLGRGFLRDGIKLMRVFISFYRLMFCGNTEVL